MAPTPAPGPPHAHGPQDGPPPPAGPQPIDGVRHIIAVASNKGGVGKSTVATNLAVALAKRGAAVGLLDADITGPNLPTMFGLSAGFQAQERTRASIPLSATASSSSRIGFLLPPNSPVVWRGPMIGSGVKPAPPRCAPGARSTISSSIFPPAPATLAMSMAQQDVPIAGAIIVSTPQPVALEDAGKAITMFEKLNVPMLRHH